MTVYFEQNQWEYFAYSRLNQLIDQFKANQPLRIEDKAYVVFDFDNTSVIGDIEDNLMVYMMDHFLYRLTPEQFNQNLVSEDFDMDYVFNDQFPLATPTNLAKDIVNHYQQLLELYSPIDDHKGDLLKDPHYLAFRSKLRYYYVNVNGKFTRQPGRKWLTYWFEGYTQDELQSLTESMLETASQTKAELIEYKTPEDMEGFAGVLRSSFSSGLACPIELKQLYSAFQSNGILTYVVSASPIDVVTVASQLYFNVPKEQVIGMNYQIDNEGRIKAIMAENSHITKKEGKTSAILEVIAPRHYNKQPIALFGDSMGDFHMMSELHDVQLNVLFNCLNNDDTIKLKDMAREQYDAENARYVVQGRDENKLSLIPNTHSIALNSTELKY